MAQAVIIFMVPCNLPIPSFKLRERPTLSSTWFHCACLFSGLSFFQECHFSSTPPVQVLLALPGSADGQPSPPPYLECFFWDCSSPEGSHVYILLHPDHFRALNLCCQVTVVFSFCEYSVFQIGLWITHEEWWISYPSVGSKGLSWSFGFGGVGYLPTLSRASMMTV